jgi:hypothetical protein
MADQKSPLPNQQARDERRNSADSQRRGAAAPGQDKTYTVTNPTTGETRTVTQREWRSEQLGKAGWEKPADLPDDGETAPQ